MASSTSLVLFFLTVAAITAAAKEFQVGDAVGWRIPATNETELYNVWASRRRFHVGDSLRFRYNTDSVVEVDKWGFYHCDSSNPISFFTDGDTLINLDKVGTSYFVSGNPDRCNKGQRMTVEVMSLHPVPHYPPSIATPPHNPYYAMSPSPSQLSSSGTSSDSAAPISASAPITALIVSLVGLGLCTVQT